jgi:hypothetical protein
MKIAALAGLAALALSCANSASAADAAAPLPLTLSGDGPYYTLRVTMAARQVSSLPELGDLRVRNAAGDAMAFAWAELPASAPAPQRVPARLYKVPAAAASAASAAEDPAHPSWIVETHGDGQDLLQLELDLERGTQGAYTLLIEAGDDLQHWHVVRTDAQLVQLQALPQVGATGALASQAGREQLKSDPLDLDDQPARYLRLTTASRSAVPPLVSATITRTPHRPTPPPFEWSEPIAASSCDVTSCEYALPRNVPVDAVQIAPADVDTIGQVIVSGRIDPSQVPPPVRRSLLHGSLHALRVKAGGAAQRAGPAWDSAGLVNVYWLTQASGAPDLHSAPLRLHGASWTMLRLETFGPISQLGRGAPTIRIGVRPRQLVFVARGAGPFVLARAEPKEMTAPLSLGQLMPSRNTTDATLPEATAVVATAASAASAPASTSAPVASAAHAAAPASSNTPWLWAALLAGLALMGAMAWSLLRKPAGASRDGT